VRARLELAATLLVIVTALLVGGFSVWDRVFTPAGRGASPEPPLPKEPVSIDGAPIRGDRNAKVALIEFSDFECSYCGKAARDILPEVNRQYVTTGRVLHVWRHYPLAVHTHAGKAAKAAECARRQGQFWAFHDWAFQHQQQLDDENLRGVARALELDPGAFAACFDVEAAATVQRDVILGTGLSIRGTPTWFVGVIQPDGRVRVTARLSGAPPLAGLQELLDTALATAGGVAEQAQTSQFERGVR